MRFFCVFFGHVAQLVEHRAFNLMVVGSTPAMPKLKTTLNQFTAPHLGGFVLPPRAALYHAAPLGPGVIERPMNH